MPRMLGDLLSAVIERQPDLTVVGEGTDPADIATALDETEADIAVVNLSETQGLTQLCSLLDYFPWLWIIAVSPSDNVAFLCRRVESRERLPGASEREILRAIRRRRPEEAH